jgi:hypothetical protein
MASIIRFVNAITGSPTTLLDLNAVGGAFMVDVDGIDLSPPPMRRSMVSGFMSPDGDLITATADGNRVIKIPLQLLSASGDAAATALQNLTKRLMVDGSILMIQLDGMTKPIFFRTYAAPDYVIDMVRLMITAKTKVMLEIPAEPDGYGQKQTFAAVAVFNDASKSTVLNTNPFFETNAAGWTGTGGTFVRSTAQFHEGAASGLLTPDGVSAMARAITDHATGQSVGFIHRADAWIRCAVTRNVDIQLLWYDNADAFLSSVTATFAMTANTWGWVTVTGTAPANAARVAMQLQMAGTPAGSNLLHIDEALMYRSDTSLIPGGMTFDVSGVLGDVETPLYLSAAPNLASLHSSSGIRRSLIAVRRRGTPGNLRWSVQSEEMTMDGAGNTTIITPPDPSASGPNANSVAVSGGIGNFARTTFSSSGLIPRMSVTWPPAGGPETRGVYAAYVRVRHTSAADVFIGAMRYARIGAVTVYQTPTVTIPTDNGSGHPNWFWIQLGEIAFPVGFDPETDGYSNIPIDAASLKLEIAYGMTTGAPTSTMDTDCLLMVPSDDRMGIVEWHETDTGVASYILDGRRTAVYALNGSGQLTDIGARPVEGALPWVSPGVTNRVYFVRDVSSGVGSTQDVGTGDILTAVTTLTPYVWPRYRVVVPAAT